MSGSKTVKALSIFMLVFMNIGMNAFMHPSDAAAQVIHAPASTCCAKSSAPSCCESMMDHDCSECPLCGAVYRLSAVSIINQSNRTAGRMGLIFVMRKKWPHGEIVLILDNTPRAFTAT